MDYVIKSNVKSFFKERGRRVSSDLYDNLEKKIISLMDQACERAQKNKRSTVMPQDL